MRNAERKTLLPGRLAPHFSRTVFPVLIAWLGSLSCEAQFAGFVPVDPYGDAGEGAFFLRKGVGQIKQTNGNPLSDLNYFYENSPVGVFLRQKSKVSFVLKQPAIDSTSADTAYRVDMRIGTKEVNPVEAGNPVGGIANYYQGSFTAEEVKAYPRAVYPEVCDSTDVHFYYGTSGPRMAIVIRPGGDPADLVLKFNGQDSLHVDWQGALRAYVGQKWVRLEQAIAYQVVAGNVVPLTWAPTYEHIDGTSFVSFEFYDYDPSHPLVFLIGYPPLPMGGGGGNNFCWSTYFGGFSATTYGLDVDNSGNLYLGGSTQSDEFPATVGVTTNPGGSNSSGVAAKFNAGHQLVWATYHGGTNSGGITSIAHSATHTALLFTGYTYSDDLPTQSLAGAYFDGTYNGSSQLNTADALLGRFAASTGQLVYATYWGTSGNDRARQVVCNQAGVHWIVGFADSGLPLAAWGNAFASSFQGGISDGYVARFNAAGQLVWSTYLGGGSNDGLNSARLDDEGNLFIGGLTRSGNYPTVSDCGTIAQASFAGGQGDCTLGKFSPTGQLCWSTYLGGGAFDLIAEADGIAIGADFVYYIANTYSTDFPVFEQSGAFNQLSAPGLGDGAIICLNRTDLSVVWATYFGGADFDQLEAIDIDASGNVYIAGHSFSTGYPASVLNDAYNQAYAGAGPSATYGDAVLTTFAHPSHACPWSTFVGGSGDLNFTGSDAALALKVSGSSRVFIGGASNSTLPPYPTFNPGNGAFFSALQASGGMALSCFDIGSVPIGVSEGPAASLVSQLLFPNPASDVITVQLSAPSNGRLEILDMSGRLVSSQAILRSSNTQLINLAGLAPGAYMLRTQSNSVLPFQASFIKQ